MKSLLEARGLTLRFPVSGRGLGRRRWLLAVDGVDLALARGQTLGIVGESGCGKSSLARALLGLLPLHAGEVWLDGQRLDSLSREGLRSLRRRMQMVFQDPQGSLDPRQTVGASIVEPLAIFEPGIDRAERRQRVDAALSEVGLSAAHGDRYPHELSGGQCQRAGIARALILRPDLLVCDEPVSALDVSVQGQVVNLLAGLRERHGLACVFISHNLAVVRHLSHEVLVMYLGRTMERGAQDGLYQRPLHPYTRALLDAVPSPVPGGPAATPRLVSGELPSPLDPPPGCAFHTRCPWAGEQCRRQRPVLEQAGDGHWVACHRWREWPRGLAPAADAWNT